MSSTPPIPRRVHPAITVRRAQSERRYLSPWQVQASWPPTPMHVPVPQPGRVRGSTWTWVDHHHHAPRTAFIPPVSVHQKRMVGHTKTVFSGGESIKLRPLLQCAQLPPLALGSPPVFPPQTLEERLAHDRLTTFLAAETLPHRPRSILSCPESPLYESLLSCFNESEDAVTLVEVEGEHEYQQIHVVTTVAKPEDDGGKKADGESEDKGCGHEDPSDAPAETAQRQPHKTPLTKLYTLDIRPEKHGTENGSEDDDDDDDDVSFTLELSSVNKKKISMENSSVHENKKAVCTFSSSSEDKISVVSLSDSDTTYQELSKPSTVIYVPSSGKRNPPSVESQYSSENNANQSRSEYSGSSTHNVGTQVSRSPSANSKTSQSNSAPSSSRSGSVDAATQVEMKELTHSNIKFFPPLTIELPETKSTGWKYEKSDPVKKSSMQNRHVDSPYIITTLDPPINRSGPKSNKTTPSPESCLNDIPPLIVNFDSEDTFSDDDTVYEMEASWSTVGDSSFYMADSDTTSLYSSIGDVYSIFLKEPDALVYVYRPPPRPRENTHHRGSTLSYRFPSYAVPRGIGSSGGSSESESSWGSGTVSFVEPSFRPSNLSVGSRGHLKIDYSCSWNRLDDFVRTTSPKDGCYGCSEDYRLHYGRSPREQPASSCMTAPAALLSPWERYSDTAAG